MLAAIKSRFVIMFVALVMLFAAFTAIQPPLAEASAAGAAYNWAYCVHYYGGWAYWYYYYGYCNWY